MHPFAGIRLVVICVASLTTTLLADPSPKVPSKRPPEVLRFERFATGYPCATSDQARERWLAEVLDEEVVFRGQVLEVGKDSLVIRAQLPALAVSLGCSPESLRFRLATRIEPAPDAATIVIVKGQLTRGSAKELSVKNPEIRVLRAQ